MVLVKNKWLRQLLGLIETGNFLYLKLLLRNRARASQYPGEVFRTYMSLVGHDRWNCKPIFDVLPSKEALQITIEHLSSDVIDTPLEQLACLALMVRSVSPRVIFEIGTFRGRTALNFALNAPPDCTIYTLDLPVHGREEALGSASYADSAIIQASETGYEYQGKPAASKIKQLYGNSQTFDFSPYFGQCDLVYIDGAHHYDAVRSDSANAIRMLKTGGFAMWDEFANYGAYNDVTRAVIDQLGSDEIVQIEKTQLAVWQKSF